MGKYAGFLTSEEVGKLEVREARRILKRCGVPKEEREEICGMISEGYFHLTEVLKHQRQYRDYLREVHGIDIEDRKYMKGWIPWIISKSPSPWLRLLVKK